MVVLPQPEVAIAIWIEAGNGPAQETFEPVEKAIDLGKLLASVGEETLYRQVESGLPHVNRQSGAIASAGETQNLPLCYSDAPGARPRRRILELASLKLAA